MGASHTTHRGSFSDVLGVSVRGWVEKPLSECFSSDLSPLLTPSSLGPRARHTQAGWLCR